MTDIKMIDRLCEETGATVDQAQTAYFRAKGNYYLALGYLREGYLSTSSGIDLRKHTDNTGNANVNSGMAYPQNTFRQTQSGYSNNMNNNGAGRNGAAQYNYNQYTQNNFSQNGFAQNGFSQNGFGQNGFAQNGFSQNGFSRNGFAQNNFSGNGYSQNSFSGNGFSQGGYSQKYFNGADQNANKRRSTAERISDTFGRFMASYLAVNTLRVPLLIALICFIAGFQIAIPAIIIAIICGVKMKFDGPLFSPDTDFSAAQKDNAAAARNNSAPEQGIPYQMPPKYDQREYEYAYANYNNNDVGEEKGFF